MALAGIDALQGAEIEQRLNGVLKAGPAMLGGATQHQAQAGQYRGRLFECFGSSQRGGYYDADQGTGMFQGIVMLSDA